MKAQSTESQCLYQVRADGIHEFVMLDFSRAGVDAFAAAIEQMSAALPPDAGTVILVDSSRGTQPLNYLLGKLRQIRRIATPTRQRTRVAIVLQSGMMGSIVSSMMRMLPQLNVRVFVSRELALDWLHES